VFRELELAKCLVVVGKVVGSMAQKKIGPVKKGDNRTVRVEMEENLYFANGEEV